MWSAPASWAATSPPVRVQGLTVTLQDQDMARIAPAIKRAATLYARRLKDPRAARAAMDRLIPDPAGTGATLADIVIEAISEQPEAKLALYRALEPRMKPDAVLATNTSSLSLETLRAGLARPERLVGIHFFNPVAKMPLVEVVHADGTADALARASAVGQIDKLALPVKSAPGFLVNAVLAPYILQAMRSVDAGVAPAAIDAALVAFGMPMGPLELADTVGLDIARAAGEELAGGQEPPRCRRTGCRAASWAARPARASMRRDGKPVKDKASAAPPASRPA